MYNYSFVCIQILGLIVTFFMCIIKFCSHLSATPITSILFLNLNLLLSNKKKSPFCIHVTNTYTVFYST